MINEMGIMEIEKLDLGKVVAAGNNRIAVEDLELLGRCCDYCRAKDIIEIGSADGGSSILLGTKAKELAGHLYCIEMKTKQRMVDNMTAYGLKGFYTLIAKASPWIPLDLLPDQADLLFIDGCHDIRWAIVDYHYFEPLVRPGGIIVFHDTSGNCAEDRRQPGYNRPGYIGLVRRTISIIMQTDWEKLKLVDKSTAHLGGAMAFEKIK